MEKMEYIENKVYDNDETFLDGIGSQKKLTGRATILVYLLQARILTSTQVAKLLNTSNESALNQLKWLMKYGYIDRVKSSIAESGHGYYILPAGVEKAMEHLGLTYKESVRKTVDGKRVDEVIYNYDISTGKVDGKVVPHMEAAHDFYLALFKNYGTSIESNNIYAWQSEGNCPLIDNESGKEVILGRADGGFIIHDKQYLIEADLGTEGPKILNTKITNYGKALMSYEKGNYPTILFPICLDNKRWNLASNNRKLKQISDAISKMKAERKVNQEQVNVAIKLKKTIKKSNLSTEGLRALAIDVTTRLQDPNLGIRALTRLTFEKQLIYDTIEDPSAPDKVIERHMPLVDLYKQEVEERGKYKAIYLKKKYNDRIKSISLTIEESNQKMDKNDKFLSLYKHMTEQGLDFYLAKQSTLLNYVEEQVRYKNKNIDILCRFLQLHLQFKHSDDINATFHTEKVNISNFLSSIISSRILWSDYEIKRSGMAENQKEIMCIEDVSYGNYGGFKRALNLVNHMHPIGSVKEISAYIIVDDEEHAFSLNKKFENEVVNWEADLSNFTFVNKGCILKHIDNFSDISLNNIDTTFFSDMNFGFYKILDNKATPVRVRI